MEKIHVIEHKVNNMNVNVKPVELIEMRYDLIFVYAISKLTALVSEQGNGVISLYGFFTYLITSCNPSCIALLYLNMANTISSNWRSMSFTFNLSMPIMLLTVVVLYVVKARENSLRGAAATQYRFFQSFA